MQLYSYTMQFADRLPFSQHLVPKYSESPAVPQFLNWGGGGRKKIPSSQTLHQVSATATYVKLVRNYVRICRPSGAGSYGRLPLATAGLLFVMPLCI